MLTPTFPALPSLPRTDTLDTGAKASERHEKEKHLSGSMSSGDRSPILAICSVGNAERPQHAVVFPATLRQSHWRFLRHGCGGVSHHADGLCWIRENADGSRGEMADAARRAHRRSFPGLA